MNPIDQAQPSSLTNDATVGAPRPLPMEQSPLPMLDALLAAGFERVENHQTDANWVLRYRHPQLNLTASRLPGSPFRPVVQLLGSYWSDGGHSFGMIEYPLPVETASLAEALAFLAYATDGGGSPDFMPAPPIPWLDEGRRHHHLLPWERELARLIETEAARPQCVVDRDWLKIGLKTLSDRLSYRADIPVVTFGFDGHYLAISGAEHPILLPANGTGPWPQAASVAVRDLPLLPRRLMSDHVSIIVNSDRLHIDRASLPIIENRMEKTPS